MSLVVTSYDNPDLDGTACAYAYAEFLKKKGKDVVAALSGAPLREAQWVLDKLGVKMDKLNVNEELKYILVDTSSVEDLPRGLSPDEIIEIIDHRKINDAEKFENAKVQIEMVGSAATLIAEKFKNDGINISEASALMLYSAIASNTINFKSPITTSRDKLMAEWLRNKIDIPNDYIHLMFVAKSKLGGSIKKELLNDLLIKRFGKTVVGIAQLEIIEIDRFAKNNEAKIKSALEDIKKEQALDAIYLSLIDVEEGFNIIFAEGKAQEILSSGFDFKFIGGITKTNRVYMRKEIVPVLKEILERK